MDDDKDEFIPNDNENLKMQLENAGISGLKLLDAYEELLDSYKQVQTKLEIALKSKLTTEVKLEDANDEIRSLNTYFIKQGKKLQLAVSEVDNKMREIESCEKERDVLKKVNENLIQERDEIKKQRDLLTKDNIDCHVKLDYFDSKVSQDVAMSSNKATSMIRNNPDASLLPESKCDTIVVDDKLDSTYDALHTSLSQEKHLRISVEKELGDLKVKMDQELMSKQNTIDNLKSNIALLKQDNSEIRVMLEDISIVTPSPTARKKGKTNETSSCSSSVISIMSPSKSDTAKSTAANIGGYCLPETQTTTPAHTKKPLEIVSTRTKMKFLRSYWPLSPRAVDEENKSSLLQQLSEIINTDNNNNLSTKPNANTENIIMNCDNNTNNNTGNKNDNDNINRNMKFQDKRVDDLELNKKEGPNIDNNNNNNGISSDSSVKGCSSMLSSLLVSMVLVFLWLLCLPMHVVCLGRKVTLDTIYYTVTNGFTKLKPLHFVENLFKTPF